MCVTVASVATAAVTHTGSCNTGKNKTNIDSPRKWYTEKSWFLTGKINRRFKKNENPKDVGQQWVQRLTSQLITKLQCLSSVWVKCSVTNGKMTGALADLLFLSLWKYFSRCHSNKAILWWNCTKQMWLQAPLCQIYQPCPPTIKLTPYENKNIWNETRKLWPW